MEQVQHEDFPNLTAYLANISPNNPIEFSATRIIAIYSHTN